MAKSNSTANDVQLKARRTSLGKKSNEDLINIILRKDKTERNSAKAIKSLKEEVEYLTTNNSFYKNNNHAYVEEISDCRKKIKSLQDALKSKNDSITEYNKTINGLITTRNKLFKYLCILMGIAFVELVMIVLGF